MTTNPFDFFADSTPDRYLGQRVDIVRRARKMQQQELALAAGIHRVSLSRKINGQQPWQFAEVVRIANALDVSVSELIEGVERVVLPRLDSNQQPFDYLSEQVGGRPVHHSVIDLAERRRRRVA